MRLLIKKSKQNNVTNIETCQIKRNSLSILGRK